ncbi:MAG: 50S ribosomal protein L21 [Pseudomonadota bacterium]
MYAVFATGGKQYRAAPGDRIRVEKLDAEEGAQIELDQVMLVSDGDQVTVGEPLVDGQVVTATVVSHGRGDKIKIVKFRRRKHSRKQMGHRQAYTEIEIVGVGGAGKAAPKAKAKPKAAPKPKKEEAQPAADEAPALKFLDAPDGEADDLQRISGVGPVLERKLNALGIYHYRQIAAFTEEEIAQVDEVLNFKGRIERDNWLAQAAELDQGKEED